MNKFGRYAFGAALLFTSVAGVAHATSEMPANCKAVRKARVNVEVTRRFWVQEGGNYDLRNEVVCKTSTTIPVLSGVAAGCTYPVLLTCQLPLDGSTFRLNTSGMIYHNDSPRRSTKHVAIGYHLDRNRGPVATGEASSTDIHFTDKSIKSFGVSINSKLDGPVTGRPTRDGFSVEANIEDVDAQ